MTLSFNTSTPIHKILRLLDLRELQIYEEGGKDVVDLFGKKGLEASLEESDVYGDQTAALTIEGGTLTLADLNNLLNLSSSYATRYIKMGLKEVSLDAYGSERNDYEYLSVTGQVDVGSDVWQLLGTVFPLTDIKFSAYVTHQSGSYRKNYQVGLTAQITLEGHQLEVHIEIATGQEGIWTLRYSDVNTGEEDKRFFTLKNLMKLFVKTDGLPEKIEGLSSVGLDELMITFDPEHKQLYRVDLAVSSTAPWDLIGQGDKARLALKNMGLRLSINAIDHRYQGQVQAEAKIGSLEASADIPIPLEGELVVNLHTPRNKPSLSDINGVLDGPQLKDHLPNDAPSELAFELSQLQVVWDLTGNSMKAVDLQLSCSQEAGPGYEVWKNHLYLQQFNLSLQLKKTTTWQSSGSIYGKGVIEGASVSVRMDKRIDGSWKVYLTDPVYFEKGLNGVKSLTSLDFSDQQNDVIPAQIEEASKGESVLRQFRVHFDPKFDVDYVSIYFETKGKTDVVKDKVTLLEAAFMLQINDPFRGSTREIVAAQLGGKLEIGEHKFHLISEKNSANANWTFSGKSQPGDQIAVTELFAKLLHAIGVDISIKKLPQATISDLELTYVPELKKLDFLGKSQLMVTEAIHVGLEVTLNYEGGTQLAFLGTTNLWIAGREFVISTKYSTENDDGWSFSADMEGEVSPGELLRAALANTDLNFPDVLPNDLTIGGVKFESKPQLNYYWLAGDVSLNTKLSDEWHLALDIHMEAVRPATTYAASPHPVEFDVSVSAEIPIGESAVLNLEGQPLGDQNGWWLTGKLVGESLSLQDLTDFLHNKIGIDKEPPNALKDFRVTGLSTTFNTYTWEYNFTTQGNLRLGSFQLDLHVNLKVSKNQEGAMQRSIKGQLLFGAKGNQRIFDLHLDQSSEHAWLIGTYHRVQQDKVTISTLFGDYLGSSLNDKIGNWSFSIQDALAVFDSNDSSRFLLSTHLGNGIDLTNLPLMGKLCPGSKQLTLEYEIAMSSSDFEAQELATINTLLSAGVSGFQKETSFSSGLSVKAKLKYLGKEIAMELPIVINDATTKSSEGEGNTSAEASVILAPDHKESEIRWYDIQQNIGPVRFGRIGIQFQKVDALPRLKFLLDASIEAKGLIIELDGLSVSSPIEELKPDFHLEGLSVDYKNKIVEIGAGLLRERVPVDGEKFIDEFNGTAVIRIKQLSIGALGSYAELDGHHSLFVYAAMNIPLGGPPFFFVTGLSAGFGYNRRLILPNLDQVMEFPLIAEAMSGKALPASADRETLMEELNLIRQYIPPSTGDVFLAAGLNFTTFKLIDSTVLLTASFGDTSAFNLLGSSTLIVPPLVEKPLARVQMAIKGAYLPEEGFAGITGQLTNDAYVLSRDCHLTGGFAFYSWFSGEHAGDFVVSVGGYHPDFRKPDHYPSVPRVGIRWDLDKYTLIKGEAYFALCAHTIMAGGLLEASYEKDGLKIWFKASANFLMAWKPFHYHAETTTHIGGSYKPDGFWGQTSLSVDLGTEIEFWGPDFGGKAKLDLYITSVEVTFGDQTNKNVPSLNWEEFKGDFLSDSKQCQLMPGAGLIGELKDSLGLFNATDLCLTLTNAVPVKNVILEVSDEEKELPVHTTTQLGIGPMDLPERDFESTLKIQITNMSGDMVTDRFDFQPIPQSIPGALWNGQLKPELNDYPFVRNALTGMEIKPKKAHSSEMTADPVPQDALPQRKLKDWDEWTKEGYSDANKPGRTSKKSVIDLFNKPNDMLKETLGVITNPFKANQSIREQVLNVMDIADQVDFRNVEDDWLEKPKLIKVTS